MGCKVKLNTILSVPDGFDTHALAVGKQYTIIKAGQRAFPLGIAVLLIDYDCHFYGYCVAQKTVVRQKQTEITFEVLTLFDEQTREIYRQNFIKAALMTGEVAEIGKKVALT